MANEKILVVDDDKNICELLRLYLVKEGYNVTMVHDGAAALTEFGGYNLRVSGHAWNSRDFGYKRMASARELADALETLYREQIFPAKKQGLTACVYTQLTDVEDELNGMLTYDREVVKIPADRMRALNNLLKDAPAEV